jgi:hypothetical protein
MLLTLCATGLLVDCGRRNNGFTNQTIPSSENRPGPRLAIRSMAELRQLLPLGLGTNEVFARLGPPDSAEESEKGRVDWTYSVAPLPADNMRVGTYVIGVTATITNGHLAWWGCVYASAHATTIRHEDIYHNPGSQPSLSNSQDASLLTFYILSTNPITGGRLIDTEEFPKLGFIASKAQLEINSLQGVTLDEATIVSPVNAVVRVWTLEFHLSETDAPRFESFTTDNVDKSFLMMVGDQPLFSTLIREPILGGNVRFESTNQTVIAAVTNTLINRLREKQ